MHLFLLISGVLSLFHSSPALAYLDPGSGSYILQVTIGLIAGSFFMIKNYWGVIKAYIQKIFSKDQNKK